MKTLQDRFFDSVFRNEASLVETALLHGTNPNEKHAISGTTPLQVACQGRAIDVISALLRAGADPNLRFADISLVTGSRKEDRVALMYAGSREAVRLLSAAGANLDAADGEGWSALSLSARDGRVEVVDELVSLGASSQLQGTLRTRYASLQSLLEEQVGHLKMLASKGPNPKIEVLIGEHAKIRELLGL